jgi:5-oxoprolinase (ATP-hydrolysing) subunit A
MQRTIDLNADLGEGFPWDYALLGRVTSASVCCGAHAGDLETSFQTLRWAKERGVVVGAHPGYPDREGFGRRDQVIEGFDLEMMVRTQLVVIGTLAIRAGATICYVKPHGALYNQAQRDRDIAEALLKPLYRRDLPILCQPDSFVEQAAREKLFPIRVVLEGFADRRYQPDGRLVPRSEPNASLEDPAEIKAQVLALVDRGIETICIHGDDPRSVDLADLVLATLKEAGVEPRSFV